jgi:hypothetical protein
VPNFSELEDVDATTQKKGLPNSIEARKLKITRHFPKANEGMCGH